MMDNKGQVFVILGITSAIIGVIVLSFSLPIMNNFIDDTTSLVDDPTGIAMALIPIMLVIALMVRTMRTAQGQQVALG